MIKKLFSAAVAASVAASAVCGIALADDEITIEINGEPLVIEAGDTRPFIENERTLVPMRAIFEALGAEVAWDGETETVAAYHAGYDISVVLQINNDKMFVNGDMVVLDVPAQIVNDRTVVPVRAIAEGLKCDVDWDGDTRTVIIESGNVEVANPWTSYATLDELNEAINEYGEFKYTVAEPTCYIGDGDVNMLDMLENGYRYNAELNMAEFLCFWSIGSGADVTIRTEPGDTDISGIYGGEKVDEYTVGDSLVEVYRYEDTLYAIWACEDVTVYSHSVAITTPDWDQS